MNSFGGLDKVFDVDREALSEIFKNEDLMNSIMRDLKNLKEKILVGKNI